jgi:acyl dehydratase
VCRLTVAFGRPVLDEDCVTARGSVTSIEEVNGERRVTCEVRLERADEVVMRGTAVVTA